MVLKESLRTRTRINITENLVKYLRIIQKWFVLVFCGASHMYHNEYSQGFLWKCADRTYISAFCLKTEAEMYVTCTVLNKNCLLLKQISSSLDRSSAPPCTPLVPKVRGTLTPPTPPGCAAHARGQCDTRKLLLPSQPQGITAR